MEHQVSLSPLLFYAILILLILSIISVVFLIVRLYNLARQKQNLETKYQEMASKTNQLQLENIDSRLNPHLFKNILNSVQSHAYQTYFALDKLSNVLDYILYDSRKKLVTPRQEVEFALNLIEINKIKLSPLFELKVKLKVNENEPLYHQHLLAPFISTDLIENAFKHADLQSEGAFISVVFEFNDNTFKLTVANKISAKSPIRKEKGGFGTEALEQRLKIIYNDHFKFDRFTEDDVYIAHLKIDLLEYKTKVLAAGR
ncbi:MAG: histidine kinase [Bacteroidetes bacterium GWB2_41_8]|nr:MAG: histidine kinase [Bacteroidetes bacterium GWB2_41_8]